MKTLEATRYVVAGTETITILDGGDRPFLSLEVDRRMAEDIRPITAKLGISREEVLTLSLRYAGRGLF